MTTTGSHSTNPKFGVHADMASTHVRGTSAWTPNFGFAGKAVPCAGNGIFFDPLPTPAPVISLFGTDAPAVFLGRREESAPTCSPHRRTGGNRTLRPSHPGREETVGVGVLSGPRFYLQCRRENLLVTVQVMDRHRQKQG